MTAVQQPRTTRRPAAEPFTPALPAARGPLSHAVITTLAHRPTPDPATGQDAFGPGPRRAAATADPYGDDLQLALHTCYELHYRGYTGTDPDWEWDPGLLRLRRAMEDTFLTALRRDTTAALQHPPTAPDPRRALRDLLTEPADAHGITHHLRDQGEWWQLREHAALRSVYHLKEADPHAWVIPRLHGRTKTALVAVEHDEYGGGRPDMIHQGLYAGLLDDLDLDPAYGAHVDAAPAPMLATVTMMSLFGLRRTLRAAMVGHFAAAEITTAPSARRMAQAMERLGAGPRARLFYTEHIEADAVHEQVLRHDVVGGLLQDEPGLAPDVVFGVHATGLLEERLAAHLLDHWHVGRSSLRHPLPDAPPRPAEDAAPAPAAGP